VLLVLGAFACIIITLPMLLDPTMRTLSSRESSEAGA
jgi:hypothetical protein